MTQKPFASLPEHLVALWHPTKNLPLKPGDVFLGTKKKIHWVCSQGHEWVLPPNNQFLRKEPCRECPPVNIDLKGADLKTLYPDIAAEAHPTKNTLPPEKVSAGSKKKYWWLGKCGHEWDAPVGARTGQNQGCPYCSSRRILVGFNDLATTNPDLADEWHPTKNGELFPTMVLRGTPKKVWWLGKCGHEWEVAIPTRANSGNGCGYCSGQKVLTGFNDLATKSPHLLEEWDYEKNTLLPTEVTSGSKMKVWWKCKNNHSWEVGVGERKKYGCLECAKANGGQTKRVPKSGSDLATQNPLFAAQWHPTKNGAHTPETVNAGSSLRVNWICDKGHEWNAKISDRRFYKSGCPVCALGLSISKPEQEIADYLVSHGVKVEQSNRLILDGIEIDIYLSEYKVGIEFNGIYWHTENKGKTAEYHYGKWDKAKQSGVQLIQIWEDEYMKNPSLIQNMLLHKIGKSSAPKVFARKTTITAVDTTVAKTFLEKNHIQGFASGSIYLGLQDKISSELVAVLTIRKEAGNTFNIIRYATSQNVVGGFTKLLKHAEKEYSPSRVITFSDNCVSDGGLYLSNGFIADKQIAPDYRYVVNNERKHKFGYRLKRFREDPSLIWDENMTEKELAKLNKIPRIWDAGKIRWVKEINPA